MTGIFVTPHPLFLGNDALLNDHEVTLELDEVRIYKAALTAEDRAQIEPGQFP